MANRKITQILAMVMVAISVSSCSRLTTVRLTLNPQSVQTESCHPHPAYEKFGIKRIAVLKFQGAEQRGTAQFVPDPKFRIRAYDNNVFFPSNGDYVSVAAERTLMESYRYDILERRKLEAIIAEHRLGLSGLISSSDAKQLGNLAGADAILSGRVLNAYASLATNTKEDGSFICTYVAYVTIEIRLVHVETGRVLFTCTVSRNSLNYLDRPLSVTNHEFIKDPRMLDVALHGADGLQRTKYVIDMAVKESLSPIL